MILENKLGIKSEIELAKEEERISKLKAKSLFENGFFEFNSCNFSSKTLYIIPPWTKSFAIY